MAPSCLPRKVGASVGLTRKGKRTKRMLVVDGQGTSMGFHLDIARPAEVRLALTTLAGSRVPQQRGSSKTRPHELLADRGFASQALRAWLECHGIRPCIPQQRSKRPC